MTTRNVHGQLTLTGYLATLNPIDLERVKEILSDSGITSRASVKAAVLNPNIITRYRLLASLLQYDADNAVATDVDVVEESVGEGENNPLLEETANSEEV